MTLKLGVYRPDRLPISIERYVAATCRELELLGVTVAAFAEADCLPSDADLFWDPGTGRPAPIKRLRNAPRPLVVTYHGAANVALPLGECFRRDLGGLVFGSLGRIKTVRDWGAFKGRRFRAIAVSKFAADELLSFAPIKPHDVFAIHHGVDHEVFRPGSSSQCDGEPFFLHVSSYQPKKNVDRILAAFARLDPSVSPRLIAVVPGYRGQNLPPNVEIIDTPLQHSALADIYRAAMGFVFPSLHETFGMPIIEAMASGCPVITSRGTGCEETAGDAALLVDPRSIEEIAVAMQELASDAELRSSLSQNGLNRAKSFTWRRSAERHLAVFEDAVRQLTET